MRSTTVKATVTFSLVAILITAVPAEAQGRNTNREPALSQVTRIVQIIRAAAARTFGPIANALPTIPIPSPIRDEDTLRTKESDPTLQTTDGTRPVENP